MQRRLGWLTFSSFILTVLFIFPQWAAAMPAPASINIFRLFQNPNADVLKVAAFFHEPCDVGGGFSYNDAEGDHTCNGANKVLLLTNTDNIGSNINLISERYPGQSVAYTIAMWLKPNTEWHPTEGYPTIFAAYPNHTGPFVTEPQVINDSANFAIMFARIDPKNDSPGVSLERTDPGGSGNLGMSYYAAQASGDNTSRPDLVLTLLYRNLPNPVGDTDTILNSAGAVYYPDTTLLNMGSASSSFILKPPARQQTISVASGDIYIGNGISNRLLPSNNTVGQTFVTKNTTITNENKCAWLEEPQRTNECPFDKLTQIGAYLFDNTTANAEKEAQIGGQPQGSARDALRNAINKAAQENAVINTDNNLARLQLAVRQFLTGSQERWRHPAGEMLILTSSVNGDITGGNNIAVVGRKVVVFAGGGSIDLYGTVRSYQPDQVAFVTLGNSQLNLSGPTATESGGDVPEFDGAYVALDVTRNNEGNFTENSAINIVSRGQSRTLNIKGLIAANEININRDVVAQDNDILRLSYDPSFAQSNLIGLSSLIRPLATGAK